MFMIKVSWNEMSSVPDGPAWHRFSTSCYQSVKANSVFAPDPFQYNNTMFFLSDRSVKASVPWYSNWKETLMELNTSTFYSGIFRGWCQFAKLPFIPFPCAPSTFPYHLLQLFSTFLGVDVCSSIFFPLNEKLLVMVV